MRPWLIPVLLAAAALAWLELRRPDRSHRLSRVAAVLVAVGAIVVLLSLRPGQSGVTLLTPGAPVTARSRVAVTLDAAQSLAGATGYKRPVRLVGWGLLEHEWPAAPSPLLGFEPAEVPVGVVELDAPGEVAAGEPLVVRGWVNLAGASSATIVLEDPALPRDSAELTGDSARFVLRDRPRAPGAADYRLRLRIPGRPEVVETLGVAVRVAALPSVLLLDASPSFETATLKRWLAERGARVTVRTRISRDRYRTEALNGAPGEIKSLSRGLLSRFDAVFADGSTLSYLSAAERTVLEAQVRERGLGLLVSAEVPQLLTREPGGLFGGLTLDSLNRAAAVEGKSDRRLVRPAWREAPRRSRTALAAEPMGLRSGGEPVVVDQMGGTLVAARRSGAGRVGVTLLRSPSRWLLENEADLYAAYWYAVLGAIVRDTTTRITASADGPLRADHPVTLTVDRPAGDGRVPLITLRDPAGRVDTLAPAQQPFDPARWTARYWPRHAGWYQATVDGGRNVSVRVTGPGEWSGLEARARLAATEPRFRAAAAAAAPRNVVPPAWRAPLAFLALLVALTWLWVEGRRTS